MGQEQLTLKFKEDNGCYWIYFFSLMSAFLIWCYRYSKRKEDQGIVVMPPSKADIGPIVFCIIGARLLPAHDRVVGYTC